MAKNLKNCVALVTGASGGIGGEIARQLADQGAKLAIHYNSNKDAAELLKSEPIFQAEGAEIYQADLTRETEIGEMWHSVESDLGPVTTLICNAGYFNEEHIPLQQMSIEQWQKTQDHNVLPHFLCMREFFRALQRNPISNPSAVLVTSMAGIWGQPYHCDYAAAKAAATYGMLPTLKDEIVKISPQGRVNAVAPGFIKTAMVQNILKDESGIKKVLQTASLRKLGQPADVAAAVTFLASPQLSGHITGEVIRLAGGKEGRVLFEQSEIQA
ncbi:MAG: SDR family oxidoreductase [Deltaproteobacteria bacterium]|jgi:3-oxoacyl-[acyl-carrier protein] reductase|nr:SDR family oxidoreductase [Deltaproteobacteria bacterium]